MKESLYTLLLFILLCLAGCNGHRLTPGDGSKVSFSSSLSSSTVSSMQRDSLGYLWVGTDRGINIFDGTNYRQMLHDRLDTASLRSDNVLGICRGRSRMWVLTDQGIDRYAGNGRFEHYRTNARSQYMFIKEGTGDWKSIHLETGRVARASSGSSSRSHRCPDAP